MLQIWSVDDAAVAADLNDAGEVEGEAAGGRMEVPEGRTSEQIVLCFWKL